MTPREIDVRTEAVGSAIERVRPELLGYLRRMVARANGDAEDILQATVLRTLEAIEQVPEDETGLRRWLYQVATNLAIDELRRHKRWPMTVILDAEDVAHQSPSFRDAVTALRGSPEIANIAREHLAVCIACTLRSLEPQEAAALLLKEVYDFELNEVADMLGATPAQAKNWLQQARAYLRGRYASTCALVSQTGACHQCEELSGALTGVKTDPLKGTDRSIRARLTILREDRSRSGEAWLRVFDKLVDEVLRAEA